MDREEAIERIKTRFDKWALDNEDMKAIQTLAPELAESEDERIRREIHAFLFNTLHNTQTLTPRTNELERWLAYLEKQKEQKPIFRVGDTMRTWDEAKRGIKDGLPHIISINSTDYLCDNEAIRISDQGDYEFPPMNRKPAEWSEEDEKFFKTALWHISYSVSNGQKTDCRCETTEWLKGVKERIQSFRPQPHWKPSEEQMRTLIRAQSQCCPTFAEILQSIHDDLKKL